MYYLLYVPIYLLSLLPMRVLHFFSDIIYGILYYIVGYRKKVVMNNLQIAFPEKPEAERRKIMKRFYHNFVDTFIETLKLISCKPAFLRKHVTIKNLDILEDLHKKGKRVQAHLGHNFNWELGNAAVAVINPFKFVGVYMPIANKAVNRLFYELRSRHGTNLVSATNMKKDMFQFRNDQYMLGLIADQVPGSAKNAYWLNFFGRPTPFIKGPERGARVGNIPVVFVQLYKRSRGYYVVEFILASENPAELPEGELTRRYAGFLETVLRKHPDMWLWSHRRWKREWKDEYLESWVGTEPAPKEQVQ
jgi:KDO2-lipid IV(A) lauroyltransferase